jgi:hypothetical protein
MKRFKLSQRRRTKISQKLPSQTEEALAKFHQFIIRLRTKKSFDLCNIFNMDETPVWFDMAGNFTVSQKREKTIQIRSTGNDKNRFTVVLTCVTGRTIFFDYGKLLNFAKNLRFRLSFTCFLSIFLSN